MLASITIMQYNNTKITYNINLCDLHNYLKNAVMKSLISYMGKFTLNYIKLTFVTVNLTIKKKKKSLVNTTKNRLKNICNLSLNFDFTKIF